MNWFNIVLMLFSFSINSADISSTLSSGCVLSMKEKSSTTIEKTYFPKLNCSNLRLTTFDLTKVEDNVVDIILSFNLLTSVKIDDFAAFTKLRRLDLKNNDITDFFPSSRNPAVKMEACKELDISYNNLDRIPTEAFRDFPSLQRLDISGNKIKKIGDEDFDTLSTLVILKMGSNPFENISTTAWSNLKSLSFFGIGFSGLKILPNFVTDLTNVTEMNLAGNEMSEIAADSFSMSKSLQKLDLSGNKIRRLDAHAFTGTSSLERLYLTDNLLETLPLGVFNENMNHKIMIDLCENPIRCDCNIAWLKHWETIHFGELSSVMPGVKFHCNQPKRNHGKREAELQTEDLTCTPDAVDWFEPCDRNSTIVQESSNDSTNNICPEKCKCFDSEGKQYYPTVVDEPNERRKLRRLWRSEDISYPHVDCSEIGITKIPDKVRTDAKTITLADNKINSINIADLKQFQSLQALDLEGCGLNNIVPDPSVVLGNLVSLSVNHNKLSSFGATLLRSFPNLITLRMYSNQLTTIPNDIFKYNRNLHHIYIGPNPVKNFDHTCLNGLDIYSLSLRNMNLTEIPRIRSRGMTHFEISDNKITRIRNNTFVDMPVLFRLTLDNNLISEVEATAFSGTAKLRYLDLSENRLTTLPAGVFDDLEEYRINIELWRNRIVCDCNLRWFKQWIEGLEVSDPMTEIRFTCFKPWRIHSTRSDSLNSVNFTCEEEDNRPRGSNDSTAESRLYTIGDMAIAIVLTFVVMTMILLIIKCILVRRKRAYDRVNVYHQTDGTLDLAMQ